MTKENILQLPAGIHEPAKEEAPALELCFRQVVGKDQDITLRTYLPNDAPLAAFNRMIDKMNDAANRLVLKRELDAMVAERAREAATYERMKTNEAQTRLDEERRIATEKVKLTEMVAALAEAEKAAREAHHASGRGADYVAKGATKNKINVASATVAKQKELVAQLEADFSANRQNYQTNLAAWNEGQAKFDADIKALKEALG